VGLLGGPLGRKMTRRRREKRLHLVAYLWYTKALREMEAPP